MEDISNILHRAVGIDLWNRAEWVRRECEVGVSMHVYLQVELPVKTVVGHVWALDVQEAVGKE
jgi:hypothetical protein